MKAMAPELELMGSSPSAAAASRWGPGQPLNSSASLSLSGIGG